MKQVEQVNYPLYSNYRDDSKEILKDLGLNNESEDDNDFVIHLFQIAV